MPANRRHHLLARALIAMHLGRPALEFAEEAARMADLEGGAFNRLSVDTVLARLVEPAEGAAMALQGSRLCESLGLELMRWPLEAVACDALRRAGQLSEAASRAHAIVGHFAQRAPFWLYAPEYWWIAAQAFKAAGDEQAFESALRRATDWIHQTALPQVPAEFKDSFLHRNPINRAVLTAVRA
jgi:tetratricopeptide (TPR) repeat protein